MLDASCPVCLNTMQPVPIPPLDVQVYRHFHDILYDWCEIAAHLQKNNLTIYWSVMTFRQLLIK